MASNMKSQLATSWDPKMIATAQPMVGQGLNGVRGGGAAWIFMVDGS